MLKANAMGRLTANPELKIVKANDENIKVCEFTLACYQSKDKTNFIKVNAWRKLGEYLFENCTKGQKLYVCGDLIIPPFNKEEQKQYAPSLTAESFEFCSGENIQKNTSNTDSEPELLPVSDTSDYENDSDYIDPDEWEDLEHGG